MVNKETAYKTIAALVERFEEQFASYKKAEYNETLTRRDFIDPFFKALGWDVDNAEGYAEAYREVIHEDKIKIGKATKAPDYSFRLVGGKRLFFVEAKKPSVAVKEEIQPAYQVRRYGWSAKLPISIITDFEEFAIYDCTKKPKPTDKASVARIKYLTFREYLTEFDFIWNTFSKERVLKGSFDTYVHSGTQKKGTATVDKDFLESLDNWRTYLAASISVNNKELDEDEINFAIQQTLDRVIFLRIAEDRSVEPYGNLLNTLKGGEYYNNLFDLFRAADEKYNSGLFDFKKDKISKQLRIDNKTLKTIISELYYPVCPYEFSVLSVEILGSAYEQFLGKQIKLDKNHKAKIEEKPEVRKAGGVYYTPQYVVDYIVKNTVGKLVEGKTPKDVAKLKIVDPACGSGSFLIGAYQFLLDWHKDYYTNNGKPGKGKKDNPLTPEGNLTTELKKQILLNNIYGVDIDVNAVEVTKLSLLLKCMEGETLASINNQLKFFNERVLPTLDENIKSGNSLIDLDFYETELDLGEDKKIKPFNWQKGFADVFKQGGFDILIGNPPWVQSKFLGESIKNYFAKKFVSMKGQYDLFNGFIENSKDILKESGLFGFIIPNRFISGVDYKYLREFILKKFTIKEITDMGENVFDNVIMPSLILIYQNNVPQKNNQFISKSKVKNLTTSEFITNKIKQNDCLKESNFIIGIYQNNIDRNLLAKIERKTSFSKFANNSRGVEIGKKSNLVHNEKVSQSVPFLVGENIGRYYINGIKYLRLGDSQTTYKDASIYSGEKIIVRKTGKGINATIDTDNHYVIQVIYIFQKKTGINENIRYLLGVLNSKVVSYYYFKKFGEEDKKAFPHVRQTQLLSIPFPQIDFKQPEKKSLHDEIVKLVDNIVGLYKDKTKSKLSSNSDIILSKIDYIETRINQLVYQLYELSPEEIAIIEAASK